MNPIVEKFLEDVKSIDSVDNLNAILNSTLKNLGFNEWAYQYKNETSTAFVLGDFPPEWVDYYLDSNFSEIDPIILDGQRQATAFQWSELISRLQLADCQKSFMNEARDVGLADGVGVPVNHSNQKNAMLTMVTGETTNNLNKTFKHLQAEIHLITLIYHQYVQDIMQQETFVQVALTQREKEVLKWASLGKTSWETSAILNISERTVNFHIENARKKLSASSKQHAVIKALINKIINI